jgi:hypothetical protein
VKVDADRAELQSAIQLLESAESNLAYFISLKASINDIVVLEVKVRAEDAHASKLESDAGAKESRLAEIDGLVKGAKDERTRIQKHSDSPEQLAREVSKNGGVQFKSGVERREALAEWGNEKFEIEAAIPALRLVAEAARAKANDILTIYNDAIEFSNSGGTVAKLEETIALLLKELGDPVKAEMDKGARGLRTLVPHRQEKLEASLQLLSQLTGEPTEALMAAEARPEGPHPFAVQPKPREYGAGASG